ncbi:AprI/Inh family metalloprotease inhibitor [Bosea vaviloviae]|uniref:Alkaline proteinase inhibitor/ Outer membrane lipoprotein Omp19 domain-containing protein n=1 Tax=Bosea vaviloviae TaxID=1526658 RepID=A0A0N1FDG3_9HYPH|nr:AprI/Inh family metalloprotease inhibitor [Bosea vaviloviae]KPH80015.1 hypothetical protein AE618_15880 [Bosea vaviloviae]
MAGRRLRLPLVAAGLCLSLAPAGAQTTMPPRGADQAPDALRPLLGAWDLEAVDQPRRCTIILGAETAGGGRQVRFPATCRRAMPILAEVSTWTVTAKGLPVLADAQGKIVLGFDGSGQTAVLQAKGGDGRDYRLDPKSYPRSAKSAATAATQAASAAQRPTIVDSGRAPAADTLPGRYSVMRQQNREACRLVLGPGSAAGGRAAFEGSCQDTGLTIFDPAGWRYSAGRLSLVARKGHTTDLVFENGQWRKDPAVGAPLLMRKLP